VYNLPPYYRGLTFSDLMSQIKEKQFSLNKDKLT